MVLISCEVTKYMNALIYRLNENFEETTETDFYFCRKYFENGQCIIYNKSMTINHDRVDFIYKQFGTISMFNLIWKE